MHPIAPTIPPNPLYTMHSIYTLLPPSKISYANIPHMKMQHSKDHTFNNPKDPNEKSSCCAISLLEGEEIFFKRILSRDSSKGFSSRIYYRVAAGSVPFEWEARPGMPKVAPVREPLLPLSPPPAMISLGLDGRNRTMAKGSTRSRLWFWKKTKAKKSQRSQNQSQSEDSGTLNRMDSFGFWSNDGDSTFLPRDSCSSSASSSSSSSSFHEFSLAVAMFPVPEGQMTMKGSGKGRGIERLDLRRRCGLWSFGGAIACMVRGA